MLYKIQDHTADLRIEFYGNTKEELVKNSAKSLSRLVFEIAQKNINTCYCKKLKINVAEDNFSEAYIDFLREILFMINTKEIYFVDIKFLEFNDKNIKADCFYVKQTGTSLKKEIKAVTYNDFNIAKDEKRWSASVTFDI